MDDFADAVAAMGAARPRHMTGSAVAHLAGTIGRQVCMLLGHRARWLWLLDRTGSPCYPSMRVKRQGV